MLPEDSLFVRSVDNDAEQNIADRGEDDVELQFSDDKLVLVFRISPLLP